MATSGSVTVKVTGYDNLVFSWELTSQSIPDNSSVVGWKMSLVAIGSSGAIESNIKKAWTVVVNGNTYTGTAITGIAGNSTKVLASGSTTIPHNADGSKTFAFSFKQVFKGLVFAGEAISDKSGSGNGTLPTIARASQPSAVTWPEHTQNVGNFGDTIPIHMNRKADTFTHTVRYAFGSASGVIARNVTTGTTWTIPLSLMDLIPRTTSGSGTIYADTYNGSTFVGTRYCGFTATVPASVKPTAALTLDDVSGVDEIYGSPVKGLSRIKATVKATPAYSSPVVSYSISANGATYPAAEATTEVLKTAGTSRVSATVTDERGRTGSTYYDMSVQDYTPPLVSVLTVSRCNEDGTANDQGDFVKAVFSAKITALKNLNTAAYVLRYKKTSATSWTSVTLSALANVYTVTNHAYIFAADGNSSYDIEVTATDRHGTASRTTSVSTAFTLMNWGANGTSFAVGKVAAESNTFEVALNNHFYGTTRQEGNRYAFSSPGTAGQGGFVLMAQVQIIAANADTPITFVFSRRQAASTMTVHLRLSNSTATASSLSSIRYEGTNYGVYAYAPDALTWNIYVLKGSNYDTITLQDWYTSHTMQSRVRVTFPGLLVDQVPTPYHRATPALLDSILDAFMPVGYVLILYSHADPNTVYPGSTWERIENAFLWATTSGGTIGQTGGASTVALTAAQLPAHSHGSVYSQHAEGTKSQAWYTAAGTSLAYGPVTTGEGEAHNNMPPYIQVSVWRRTA